MHLKRHEKTLTRELLQPYLEYELWLRKAFAQGKATPDGKANLVPLLDESQPRLHIRDADRVKNDPEKYLMRLPDSSVQPANSPATAKDLDKFKTNFDAFTHGILRGLGMQVPRKIYEVEDTDALSDWTNIAAAGSSALLPLLPYREDVKVRFDAAVEATLETYYQ